MPFVASPSRSFSSSGVPADTGALEPSAPHERHLIPELTDLVREFLGLNRRRFRQNPSLDTRERDRWNELSWQIQEALGGPSRTRGAPRKALRVPANLKVEYSDPLHHEVTNVREIAERGLFLATDRFVPVGTPLNLKLTGDGGETVEAKGSVVWVRRVGEPGGLPGIGVEFVALRDEQREAVAYLVEEALAAL
jgi:uncharacterized protein (TIGR02266 family)